MAVNGNAELTNAHTPPFGLAPGPITEVHAFWLAGMSCDGCSIAAVGAQHPSVEQLVSGSIPGLPKVVLHHPVLAVSAGEAFIASYRMAREGKLGLNRALKAGAAPRVEPIGLPRRFRYLERLPETSQGKVLESELRSLFTGHSE